MLGHDVGMVQYLLKNQPAGNSATGQNAEHAQGAEKVQRARKIFEQEADGDEVKEYPEGTRDAVMRSTALPVDVLDGYLDDGCAMPRSQCWNEAMQLPVERNLIQYFAAIGFESGTEIVNIDPAQLRHKPVRAARGETAQPEIVDAIFTPSADDVVALGNFFEEQRDVGGIVL